MFYLIALLVVTAVMANQTTNWSDICGQIQSGNYKTVRLTDSRMQLLCGQQSYTFTIGDIRSAQITQISNLYPFDLSPIDECFENNGKVYYIRNNELIQYNGLNVNTYHWNQNQPSIPCLIIKKSGQTIGFFVPNNSCSYSSGQSMSTTNDIQVIAYGSASSVSMSSYNNVYRLTFNSMQIPLKFNAFIANSDNSFTFFNGSRYCVVTKNDNSNDFNWKDVKTLFGC